MKIKNSKLMTMIFLAPMMVSAQQPNLNASNVDAYEERINKLEEDILDLKINSLGQKIKWSGDLVNSFDYYNSDGYTLGPASRNYQTLYNRLRLHANSSVNKSLSVYTTISASQYANQSLTTPQVSLDQPINNSQGLAMRMEKAFFEYSFLDDQLTISGGRLPTAYGPPQNIRINDQRQGTYPSFAYSVPLDGMALTWKMDQTFHMQDSFKLRFIGTPTNNVNVSDPFEGMKAGSQSNTRNLVAKNSHTLTIMSEFETKRLPHVEHFVFILHALQFDLGRMQPIEARGVLDSFLAGDSNTYEIAMPSEHALTARYATTYLEFENIMNTNLTFYMMHKYTRMNKRGDLIATIIEDNDGGALGAKGTANNIGGFLTGTEDRKAMAQLYGLNWKNSNERFSTGVEYVNTHLGTVPSALIQIRPTTFYNNIGKGYHIYTTYAVIPKYMTLLFGYTNSHSTHDFSGFSYVAKDQTKENIYLTALIKF